MVHDLEIKRIVEENYGFSLGYGKWNGVQKMWPCHSWWFIKKLTDFDATTHVSFSVFVSI